jgi:hypothetical protein
MESELRYALVKKPNQLILELIIFVDFSANATTVSSDVCPTATAIPA